MDPPLDKVGAPSVPLDQGAADGKICGIDPCFDCQARPETDLKWRVGGNFDCIGTALHGKRLTELTLFVANCSLQDPGT